MSSEPIEYLEPWWSTADQDVVFHEQFHEQLEREVGPGHVLYHVPVRLIARHDASDDCLFELLDGSGRIAIVHLICRVARDSLTNHRRHLGVILVQFL